MSQSYQFGTYGRASDDIAAYSPAQERAAFMRRTYLHVAGAVGAFLALEFLFFRVIPGTSAERALFSLFSSTGGMLVLMALFIGSSFVARTLARSETSVGAKYLGLALYVFVEAVIFYPILYICGVWLGRPDIIQTAGVYTLCLFAALTVSAFITRRDFSFLAPIITTVSFLMLGVIVCAVIFGFSPGMWFSFLGIGLASAAILYDTSNIIHHYRTDQHVAAALELFASIATMFYYILRLLMQTRD
jgi:FtsH-binding integral membrane protein